MAATDVQFHAGVSTTDRTVRRDTSDGKLVTGLGWFSIGLGLGEIAAPGAFAALIGVEDDAKTRRVLRGYGVREIAAGIGILSQPRPVQWLWSRVAGDVLDLSSLGKALTSDRNQKTRVAAASAAVAGITALDLICAQRMSSEAKQEGAKATKAVKTITVNRSQEEAYNYWRNFENLPTFMTYLESVRTTGDRRSHWVARGPGGMKVEWDAELVRDDPNRLIAWRSIASGAFANTGSVQFDPAPGRRGTLVRVELDFAPNGGVLNSALGKILGTDIGARIMHDLRNFKQVLEVGEVTQSDASMHPGMHPAQPPADQRA